MAAPCHTLAPCCFTGVDGKQLFMWRLLLKLPNLILQHCSRVYIFFHMEVENDLENCLCVVALAWYVLNSSVLQCCQFFLDSVAAWIKHRN